MHRYKRSDATPLSSEDIQDIIKAKNSMKRASETMAKKYKISSRRVYQIWRGLEHPPDPLLKKNINWDKKIENNSDIVYSIDTSDTPDTPHSTTTSHSIIFFINTTDGPHIMNRTNTPHNIDINMVNPSPRRYMRSDATKLSTTDYEDIMQYRDMKSKPLEQLRKKFHISTSLPLSYSSTNAIDKQDIPEATTLLENMIRDVSLECNTTSDSKKKKTGGKNPKSKSVSISDSKDLSERVL
ncbi:240_t:CDS:2, partial [Dentiscutata erythropus]